MVLGGGDWNSFPSSHSDLVASPRGTSAALSWKQGPCALPSASEDPEGVRLTQDLGPGVCRAPAPCLWPGNSSTELLLLLLTNFLPSDLPELGAHKGRKAPLPHWLPAAPSFLPPSLGDGRDFSKAFNPIISSAL